MKVTMTLRSAGVARVGLAYVLAMFLTACGTAGPRFDTAAGGAADAMASRENAPADGGQAYVGFPDVQPTPPGASAVAPVPAGWKHYKLPGKQATAYAFAPVEQRLALSAVAVASASMLRQTVHTAPEALRNIKFSWKVPALIRSADLSLRETHDSPVRVVLAFEGDRAKFSMKNAMLSELAHAMTGEPLPYATLMYVWCNQCERGSVIVNPRTDRIREIVLESGPEHLGQWQDYERDIRADFERAFGEAPGALVNVAVRTDTDNTRESTSAWYGPISLTR